MPRSSGKKSEAMISRTLRMCEVKGRKEAACLT
jgi:hypothetical protein